MGGLFVFKNPIVKYILEMHYAFNFEGVIKLYVVKVFGYSVL